MTVDINETTVERRTERLQESYGDVPIRQGRWTVSEDEFRSWVTASRDGYVGSAYVLVRRPPEETHELTPTMSVDGPERKRVLLVLPRGEDRWGLPGGGLEEDESFADAAVREVLEETGIDCELTGLAFCRHDVTTGDGDSPERLHALRAFFTGRYVDGTISIQPGEMNGAAWVAEPPERLLPGTERILESRWETQRQSRDSSTS
ncbi:NUDIX domain-containing protein [Halobacteria archaeon AArc-m2/3/4]|uniref:NUDIX domain-containing protein n=1 Tax=Natronoglomus mannanivorans TaxID=2979990 RepID=A0ABT2QEL2_9EURY|nr:NUDIX domain-containing protein [Halobacteria archaeon AArc-m2/3/4]